MCCSVCCSVLANKTDAQRAIWKCLFQFVDESVLDGVPVCCNLLLSVAVCVAVC